MSRTSKHIGIIIFWFILQTFCIQTFADIKVRGFVDVVGSSSNTTQDLSWLGNEGKDLNMDGGSRLGLNLSAELDDRWQFAGQLVGRGYKGVSGQPSYILAADWLFLTYRPDDSWMIRVGRQIYPLFFYSEQIDVGFTYLWARLPTAVYGMAPVKSFNGLSASYGYSFNDIRATFGIYGGSGQLHQVSAGIGGLDVHEEHVRGGYASLSSEKLKVQATYKASHPLGTIFIPGPGGIEIRSPLDLGNLELLSLGAGYDLGPLSFISEVSKTKSSLPSTFDLTGTYGTIAYKMMDARLIPHFTFGKQWSDSSVFVHPDQTVVAMQGASASQTGLEQIIFGLNFRTSTSTVLKFEYEKDQLVYRNAALNFGVETFTVALSAVF